MGKTTFSGPVISINGYGGGIGVIGPGPKPKVTLTTTSTQALEANTNYVLTTWSTGITSLTLPLPELSREGDVVLIESQVATPPVGAGNIIKIGTPGETLALESTCYKPFSIGGVRAVVTAATGNIFFNMQGVLNGGPGIGSKVIASFNGENWRIDADLTTSGGGSVANPSVYGATSAKEEAKKAKEAKTITK